MWRNGLASFLTMTRKSQQNHFKANISCISLANNRLMGVTQLSLIGLGSQTVKNLPRLRCKFELDQSERKSSQVNASAPKAWPNGVASRPKFSTFNLRVCLVRAYDTMFPYPVRVRDPAQVLFPLSYRRTGIKVLIETFLYNQCLR